MWQNHKHAQHVCLRVTRASILPQQDALLDFYGVPVKASEVRSHVDRMRLLADKVPTRKVP